MFGSDPIIGVKPANEFQFRVFGTPVGPYFKGGIKPLTIRVSDLDRAAPRGTGHIKAGLNYAMSLYNIVDAHEQGYDENLYVDSATRTHIEETGGANIVLSASTSWGISRRPVCAAPRRSFPLWERSLIMAKSTPMPAWAA